MTRQNPYNNVVDNIIVIRHYVGEFELGTNIHCPFPDTNDANPSFVFFEGYGNKIWWKYFSTDKSGDTVSFISKMEGNISTGRALQQYKQILKAAGKIDKPKLLNSKKISKAPHTLRLSEYYTMAELRYWYDRYNITATNLIEYNVFGLYQLRWKDCGYLTTSSVDEPKFIYLLKRGEGFQFYNPLAKNRNYKWGSWNLHDALHNEDRLKGTEDLHILTSKKDGMVWETHYQKGDWVAPIGEGNIKALLNRAKRWRKKYRNIYVIPDTDEQGLLLANELVRKTNWKLKIIDFKNQKDLSDYYEKNKKTKI